MKEIIEAFLVRLKSPFLGMVTLIYVAFNFKSIVTFFIVNNEEKLKIIDAYSFDWKLALGCALLSFSYLVFSDWLQLLIDMGVLRARELRKSKAYESQAKIVEAEYKSSKEYLGKLIDKELLNWKEEKDSLLDSLAESKEIVDKNYKKYHQLEQKFSYVFADRDNKLTQLNDQRDLTKALGNSIASLGVKISDLNSKTEIETDFFDTKMRLEDLMNSYLKVQQDVDFISTVLDVNIKEANKEESETNKDSDALVK
ncbi:hypothetical protein F0237_10225 [Vibrio tubiashii]|uniref:Uncharacterized protein n=1 Tax=Vibrio tubiashii TaxID=29498 RepID=A0AAE5LHY4_9VIBR|nr:hypothetical protein [Vibrio tubiashii]NOI81037.1 hypothetical protein [Vibrio tubiashii]